MDEKNVVPTPVHELDMARMERVNHRQAIVIVLLILAFTVSTWIWAWREMQYEDVLETTTVEAEQDSNNGGNNYIVGGDFGGKANSQDNSHTQN